MRSTPIHGDGDAAASSQYGYIYGMVAGQASKQMQHDGLYTRICVLRSNLIFSRPCLSNLIRLIILIYYIYTCMYVVILITISLMQHIYTRSMSNYQEMMMMMQIASQWTAGQASLSMPMTTTGQHTDKLPSDPSADAYLSVYSTSPCLHVHTFIYNLFFFILLFRGLIIARERLQYRSSSLVSTKCHTI